MVLGGAGLGEAAWNFFCLGGLDDFKNWEKDKGLIFCKISQPHDNMFRVQKYASSLEVMFSPVIIFII